MTTASKPASKASSKVGETKSPDAIQMLTDDHKMVKALFKQFEKLKENDGSDDEKGAIALEVCAALKVHAQIEEEIFYPAVYDAIDDTDLMDEAEVEHASAKELIEQIEAMQPGDDLYDAKVTVLAEQIDHHVKEEESEMFPKARKAKIDVEALGNEMQARRVELMAEMGMDEPKDSPPPKRKPTSKGNSMSA